VHRSCRERLLASGGRIAAHACAGARIDHRGKRIRVEPLQTAGLGHVRDGSLAVQRHARNPIRILRPAALEDAMVVRGVGRAENAERQPAVQNGDPRHQTLSESLGRGKRVIAQKAQDRRNVSDRGGVAAQLLAAI
jgi:hypothetical protein